MRSEERSSHKTAGKDVVPHLPRALRAHPGCCARHTGLGTTANRAMRRRTQAARTSSSSLPGEGRGWSPLMDACCFQRVPDPLREAVPLDTTNPQQDPCPSSPKSSRDSHRLPVWGCRDRATGWLPGTAPVRDPPRGGLGTWDPPSPTLSTPSTVLARDGATARRERTSGPSTQNGKGMFLICHFQILSTRLATGLNPWTKSTVPTTLGQRSVLTGSMYTSSWQLYFLSYLDFITALKDSEELPCICTI